MITNTLEDAALWLTEAMGGDWTAKQVLDAVIRTCDQTAEYPREDITCLRVLPPKNTAFGVYKRDPESYAVALQCLTLDCEFQLTFNAAFALFTHNETNVSIVKNAVSSDEPYVVIEPRGESLRVTLDMVRISAGALQGLAMAYEQEKRLLPIKQDDYLFHWGDGLEHERLVTTHAYLAKIAHLHHWDTYSARKLIVKCTEQLSKWDGSLLALLKAGPQTDTQQAAPEQNTTTPADELDYSLLATPSELLEAFGKWGMKTVWFDDLNSRKWLLDARREKGQGQRGHAIKPLFCPFAVMNGLINNVRKVNRLNPDTAWRTLEHKFPDVYSAFEMHDPREQTGD